MAVTRLGLSGTPRAALTTTTRVVASLAQWQWSTYPATVAVDRAVTANLAQWQWTPLQATVSVERTISASLATWTWTPNAATVALTRQVQANLGQWAWTTYPATVTVTPSAVSVTANLAQWTWTTHRATVSTGETSPTGGWLTDPHRNYDEDREERVRLERIRLGILPSETAAAKETLTLRKPPKRSKRREYVGLNMEEASRLIDALEDIQQTRDRAKRIAAILLLAA